MKKFRFPLEKLRSWRQTQFDLEEGKLEKLLAQLAKIQVEQNNFSRQVFADRQAVGTSNAVMSTDLAALDRWLKFSVNEQARLRAQEMQISKDIAQQREAVLEARRKLEILNRFKDQQKQVWQRELDAEQEAMVAELVVSRWKAKAGS